jgi:cbb3-type cytochrome oxidase subunit 3
MRRPPSAFLLPLLLAGCSAGSGSPSGAARTTFVLFLIFLAGIFFIDHRASLLDNPRVTAFLHRHIRKLYAVVYLLGAAVALAALLAAFFAGQGRIEALCISLIILGLCCVFIAFCLKRWEETDEHVWLRRNTQIMYAGIICFSAINALLGGAGLP